MEEERGISSAGERCPQCGMVNPAEASFCMHCGAELAWPESSVLRLMKHQLADLVDQLVNPVFAFLKSVWLFFTHPRLLAKTLASRERPAAQLPFPLHGIWRLFSPEVVPYVLTPVEFFFSALLLNIVLGGLSEEVEEFASETAELFAELPSATMPSSSEMELFSNFTLELLVLLVFLMLFVLTLVIAQNYRFWLGRHRSEEEKAFWGRTAYFHWLYAISGWQLLSPLGDRLVGHGVPQAAVSAVMILYFAIFALVVFAEGGWGRSIAALLSTGVIALVAWGVWLAVGMVVVATLYAFLVLGVVALLSLPGWVTYLCLWPLLLGGLLLLLWGYRRLSAARRRRRPPASQEPRA